MKLRKFPQDFHVEELIDLKMVESGPFKLYLLKKRGLETFYTLHYLSRLNNIPRSDFGYAGLKDKHAITAQYITIPSGYEIKTLKEPNFEVSLLGYLEENIERGALIGNRFEITVRDIKKKELNGAIKRSQTITTIGVPNYYDSQRFGSVVKGVFIGKLAQEGNYADAMKAYLTLYNRSDHRELKKDKRSLLANWDDISKAKVTNITFQKIISEYLLTKDWSKAYAKIPSNIKELHKHSFESYLWNEKLKEFLEKLASTYLVKYNAGMLLFYDDITENDLKSLPQKIEGRDTIVRPKNFKISQPQEDESTTNKFKITVSFDLPKASYATIVTKRLFKN